LAGTGTWRSRRFVSVQKELRQSDTGAHPECQLGDERFVAAQVTDPDEYARLYGLAEQVYAGYGDYRVKTATIGRKIPVFRLKPVSP
jgi:hypothetical protein